MRIIPRMWHFVTTCFIFSDLSLGRVDKSSFSQQTLMDLLIEHVENTENICSEHKAEIKDWTGLIFSSNWDVIEINWAGCDISGSIAFQWLPDTVRKVSVNTFMKSNNLKGTIDTSLLPRSLREFNVFVNELTEELALDCLPAHLEMFSASFNKFFGTIDLTQLPQTLQKLHLDGNSFAGPVRLTCLPKAMTYLSISTNQLSGSLNLRSLPSSLERLDVSQNTFSGGINLRSLPKGIKYLFLRTNRLSGSTDFSQLPMNMIFMDVSSNVDLKGEIVFSKNSATTVNVDNSKVTVIG